MSYVYWLETHNLRAALDQWGGLMTAPFSKSPLYPDDIDDKELDLIIEARNYRRNAMKAVLRTRPSKWCDENVEIRTNIGVEGF